MKVPIIAEGHISTPEELVSAYKSGADSVVVGSAITRPEIITKRFVDNLEQLKKRKPSRREPVCP